MSYPLTGADYAVFKSHNPNHEKYNQRYSPNLQPFAFLLDAQPPEAQEAFQFPPATAMHKGGNPRFGKFELLGMAEVDGRWHYSFSGASEVFRKAI